MELSSRIRKVRSSEATKTEENECGQRSMGDNRGMSAKGEADAGQVKEAPTTMSTIGWLLELDVQLTNKLAVCATKESPYGHLRPLMQVLEYSGHGIVWLTLPVAGILMTHKIHIHQKLMNLYLGMTEALIVSYWYALITIYVLICSRLTRRPLNHYNNYNVN